MLRLNTAMLRDGFERLNRRLMSISRIGDYAGPLMERWERVIEADNRRGVLAGTDRYGHPAPRLKYRPVGKPLRLTADQRLGQKANRRRGVYMGQGPAASGLHNNLTSGEYRRLDGPRLAPRKQFSRVITNLVTGHGREPGDPRIWFAEGVWAEVVSVDGTPFLRFHFDGDGQAKYDLRGVRIEGAAELVASLEAWAKLQIRERWNAAG